MAIQFDQVRLPKVAQELRREVRAFIAEEVARGTFDRNKSVTYPGYSPEFSRKVGAKGWIGITWPKKYGGAERSFLERYVITEEFRVANAPVGLHFTADRQSGPMLLKYANERIKADIL
ncbi:MAG TPA: acyl-CoA dehydrogenase family protein, partial [Steroidobacteraceae bacterium]|nr:acyl-CoA dehydrogenase family protein [Steroidobacteraceae bacterium]